MLEQELQLRRHRGIYSASVVIWLMIWQRLHQQAAMERAVGELRQGPARALLSDCKRVREDRISSSAGAYCQSLSKLPKQLPAQLMQASVETLSRQLSQPWPGLGVPVFLLDGSSLQLPHTAALADAYPPGRGRRGVGHWPILRLVVAHEIGSGMALHPHWGPMYGDQATSEQGLCVQVLRSLPAGAAVMADRNFGVFSVAWAAVQGQHPVIVRLTKDRAQKLFGGSITQQCDSKLVWKASRYDRPQAEPWPDGAELHGRLVVARLGRGQSEEWIYLFTTTALPVADLIELYARRWEIETDLRSLKQTLRLQRLSARSVDGVEKELLLAMITYNLVRAVMCLAAGRAGLPTRRISFTSVLHLISDNFERIFGEPTVEAQQARFDQLVQTASAYKLPQRNKPRSYPREVWGRGGSYPAKKTK